MCVASELSSEVAEAILEEKLDGRDAARLLEIVVTLHATLRKLSLEARVRRRAKIFSATPTPGKSGFVRSLQ